jgi:hypothetical protein
VKKILVPSVFYLKPKWPWGNTDRVEREIFQPSGVEKEQERNHPYGW